MSARSTSLRSPTSGNLVTHRVTAIDRDGSAYLITMEGDANKVEDPDPYRVEAGSTVLHPIVTIPAAGNLVLLLARPAVSIPLAIAVLALIALSLVTPRPPARHMAAVGGVGMSGSRRFGASAIGALVVTILAIGTGLALAPTAADAAPAPEFTLDFPGLQPGVPQTDTGSFRSTGPPISSRSTGWPGPGCSPAVSSSTSKPAIRRGSASTPGPSPGRCRSRRARRPWR